MALVIDYTASPPRDSLLTYYRHTLGSDPLVRLGEQDISAHVDLRTLVRLGIAQGLKAGAVAQRGLLYNLGFPQVQARLTGMTDREALGHLVDMNAAAGRSWRCSCCAACRMATNPRAAVGRDWPEPGECTVAATRRRRSRLSRAVARGVQRDPADMRCGGSESRHSPRLGEYGFRQQRRDHSGGAAALRTGRLGLPGRRLRVGNHAAAQSAAPSTRSPSDRASSSTSPTSTPPPRSWARSCASRPSSRRSARCRSSTPRARWPRPARRPSSASCTASAP